jgi:flagellar secretion chaperone FliS
MQNLNYQQQSVTGKNGVELIVALYDGMVRFLNSAIAATEAGDVQGRRIAVKRVFDILIHLQSRLRMDVGGPAKTLSEFYAAVFALCLEGSRLSSPDASARQSSAS